MIIVFMILKASITTLSRISSYLCIFSIGSINPPHDVIKCIKENISRIFRNVILVCITHNLLPEIFDSFGVNSCICSDTTAGGKLCLA